MKYSRFLASSLVVLICLLVAANCSKQYDEDPGLAMAQKVAMQLDRVSDALDAVNDYESAQANALVIGAASENLASLYRENSKLKTNATVAKEITSIVEPSSERLIKARQDALARLGKNEPAKIAVILALNRFSSKFSEMNGGGADKSNSPQPDPADASKAPASAAQSK
ncbi:MAG: hypothetical protein AB8F34_07965 [Akkermansiaceae bacterium]